MTFAIKNRHMDHFELNHFKFLMCFQELLRDNSLDNLLDENCVEVDVSKLTWTYGTTSIGMSCRTTKKPNFPCSELSLSTRSFYRSVDVLKVLANTSTDSMIVSL